MERVGKKFTKAQEAVAVKPQYPLPEAVAAVAKHAFAKFDETRRGGAAARRRPQARRPDGARHGDPAPRPGRQVASACW